MAGILVFRRNGKTASFDGAAGSGVRVRRTFQLAASTFATVSMTAICEAPQLRAEGRLRPSLGAPTPAPPRGSYLTSCIDIAWFAEERVLRARCRNAEGAYVEGVPTYVGHCVGDVFNVDGIIGCSSGEPTPPGPYAIFCPERWVSGTRLHARCRPSPLLPPTTSDLDYTRCLGPIAFGGSVLLCDQGKAPPEGSYRRTCKLRAFVDDRLELTCASASGGNVDTRLWAVSTCASDITNDGGTLRCRRRDDLPEGSYLQTCEAIRRRSDALDARCRKYDGRLEDTTLRSIVACATRDIGNDNGRLMCEPPATQVARDDRGTERKR